MQENLSSETKLRLHKTHCYYKENEQEYKRNLGNETLPNVQGWQKRYFQAYQHFFSIARRKGIIIKLNILLNYKHR